MANPQFIQIGDRVFNVESIRIIRKYDDGSIRIFTNIKNLDNPVLEYHYDYEGEEAAKIFSYFESLALKVI